MGSPQTMQPESGLIRVPLNYPTAPSPGKLQLLLEQNEKSIYHRYSPYAEYDDGWVDKILGFGSKQPYIYDYIDKAKSGLSGLRRYESRVFPIGSAPRDVIRVSKFLGSGRGVAFLGKQFILQANQAFNETQLYNPISPIIAAGMSLAIGQVRPMRHIDIFGGIGGIARSLLGNLGGALADTFLGASTVKPPPGTVGQSALPTRQPNGGKGLLRGKTADAGLASFNKVWASPNSKFSWKEFGKSIISSLIPFTFPKRQPSGTKYRADEGSYGIMLNAGLSRFVDENGATAPYGFYQKWIAGGKGMRKGGQRNFIASRMFLKPDGVNFEITSATTQITAGRGVPTNIRGIGRVGVTIEESTKQRKPGVRYGDAVGANISEDVEASEVMLDYARYVQPIKAFDSKKIKKTDIEAKNESLQKVINSLKKSGVYKVSPTPTSPVLPSGTNRDPYNNGYNALFKTKTNGLVSPLNYPKGTLSAYRDKDVRMVDSSISNDPVRKSLKLPGAGQFDALNTLVVLPGNKSGNPRQIRFSPVPGWTKWEPYKDDQIAFFFYDAVNDKYIPFRATVKNISENVAASWEEMTFIGRADRLYSYGGFSRALTFSFDIHIGSIIELGPTWKRINYLMSLVKPSRYTKSQQVAADGSQLKYNRFMVPPMVLLTIGDLYKQQPILLNNLTLSVPDDAIWETLNEENTPNQEWSYLVDYMKANEDKMWNGKRTFGQFPRLVTIQVGGVLLEKQRAIVGAAHFGHAPHTDKYYATDIDSNPMMHRTLVEYQGDSDGA